MLYELKLRISCGSDIYIQPQCVPQLPRLPVPKKEKRVRKAAKSLVVLMVTTLVASTLAIIAPSPVAAQEDPDGDPPDKLTITEQPEAAAAAVPQAVPEEPKGEPQVCGTAEHYSFSRGYGCHSPWDAEPTVPPKCVWKAVEVLMFVRSIVTRTIVTLIRVGNKLLQQETPVQEEGPLMRIIRIVHQKVCS
ncbi:hypothetical protein [Candidatus Poriferisodalis sp.]|uniref:hypothetical protein n=1 Tax=Candidatus Poriferisodalis sp. TaxID=3101277 RepID=UPI003B01A194